MKLDRIYLEGYKSFEKLDLTLGNLNVLIGANGSGKSNFISLFRLLNEMVLENFRNYIIKTGGSETYLHHGEKTTSRILLKLEFGENSYEVCWEPNAKEMLMFVDEKISSRDDKYELKGAARAIHDETSFESGFLTKQEYGICHLQEDLLNLKVFHFHDTSDSAKIKKIGDINDNEKLRMGGENLAAFLYGLKAAHPEQYEKIRHTVRLAAPFFDDFHLRPMVENPEKIRLEWRQRGSDYPYKAYYLSDGTLRFMCLAAVLLQPNPPATIIIDEPELGLHPYAISILGELMRSASTQTQLIVSTQSVELVNQFSPENLLVVDRDEQKSLIKRLEKNALSEWLKDYTLGDLWKKNVFGGVL